MTPNLPKGVEGTGSASSTAVGLGWAGPNPRSVGQAASDMEQQLACILTAWEGNPQPEQEWLVKSVYNPNVAGDGARPIALTPMPWKAWARERSRDGRHWAWQKAAGPFSWGKKGRGGDKDGGGNAVLQRHAESQNPDGG